MGWRKWQPDEIEYLCENWGHSSLGTLAQNLGRSKDAIKSKAVKWGLGAFLESGDYISFNQLTLALGRGSVRTYQLTSWVANRGLPIHTQKVDQNSFKIVKLEEFWKWAEINRHLIDFSKMEKHILGREPDWVKVQRKLDFENNKICKLTPWSTAEDRELTRLLKLGKYSYLDLCKKLRRSSGAILKRIIDLGISERPVRAPKCSPWTQEEYKQFAGFIKEGYRY